MARGENTANHPNRQVHRNRWGDVIDPNNPKPRFTPHDDEGNALVDEEGIAVSHEAAAKLYEPTFLEGPLGYRNWTDARVNRYG